MKNSTTILLVTCIIILITSCQNQCVTEHYENGNIKGVKYLNNERIDSLLIFHNDLENNVKNKNIYLNDYIEHIEFYSNGQVRQKGKLSSDSLKFEFWDVYNKKGVRVQTSEYININGLEHINRDYRFDAKGDTLLSIGNFYKLIVTRDTLDINEITRLYFYIQEPLFSYDSKLVLYKQKNKELVLSDFSKIHEIELDTIQSLKYDGIDHNELSFDSGLNRMILFEIGYQTKGLKNIKGYISEYKYTDVLDSLKYEERRLYFDKNIYVK